MTGTITDPTGKGIAGATVTVKGTRTATQTNETGEFAITAPANATLVVTAVGFATQEIPVNNQSSLSVNLAAQESSLNEVVVIGYGTARRKDLTGAVASLSAKDFNKGVIAAPDQLLQNKVPGLQITTNSGQPGSATTVKIRGNNSIRAVNNPLYVIDGVPLDGRSARPNFGNAFGSTPDANPLIFVNPNDISRIDVLK
ncbi:MAG TPA: carboxypeptidase-like regulatory domain-containing protein, partial [Flavisolibacter sp.]|nr:carboxypeptidase-like regulatory domain-containing protein [Flavisolibacter sp.]